MARDNDAKATDNGSTICLRLEPTWCEQPKRPTPTLAAQAAARKHARRRAELPRAENGA